MLKFGGGVPAIRKGLMKETRRFENMRDATLASVAEQQNAVRTSLLICSLHTDCK